MGLILTKKAYPKTLEIELPISKSIVARQLLILYVSNTPLEPYLRALEEHSISRDIEVIASALKTLENRRAGKLGKKKTETLDCSQSATALRMLSVIALYEQHPTILKADPQLYRRISQDDLSFINTLGADYRLNREHKTLTIIPSSKLPSGLIRPQWSTSQYASAIEICNYFQPAHQINYLLPHDFGSQSYITLTKYCLEQYSKDNSIKIERDWSAASFWYQLIASVPDIKQVALPQLSLPSAQPDARISQIYRELGIETITEVGRIILRRSTQRVTNQFEINLSQNPDLFLPLALTLVKLSIPFKISGLESLRHKESNRITAFTEEVAKYGVTNVIYEIDSVEWKGDFGTPPRLITIDSYDDHRVAMAFGVFATTQKDITTQLINPQAVSKSYPMFFDQLLE